jgi:group II intron reverse transcriptase/maturase
MNENKYNESNELKQEKNTKNNINKEETKKIKSDYFETHIKGLEVKDTLAKLLIISTHRPDKKFNNLKKILINEYLIGLAYENIKSNKGALTPGTDNKTYDETSIETFQKIKKKLKEDNYKYKPVRRIYVPKPGKNKMRPIGIPTTDDRLVQESLRLILNAIYEPEFERQNCNFGFRPTKSVHDAIDILKKKSRGLTYAIEGDIVGAYDNVNQGKLIKILKKKINDKKFIRIINNSFTTGLIDQGNYKDTFLGVPQGGIASPLLFNIYMNEFDKYICDYLDETIGIKNIKEDRKKGGKSKIYERYRGRTRYYIDKMKKIKNKRNITDLSKEEYDKYKEAKKRYKIEKLGMLSSKSTSQKKLLIRYTYVRYADDWIIITNGDLDFCSKLKTRISSWLKEELDLDLSEEKTKITNIKKEPCKFIGFTIQNNQEKIEATKVTIRGKETKRRTARDSKIGIDTDRVINRLKIKGFLDPKENIIHNKLLFASKPHEIVTKYKQILEGFGQYYIKNITFKSSLIRYYYILKFSCLKTIANRQKTSITQISKKYGKNLKIEYNIEKKDRKGKTYTVTKNSFFPTWKEYMKTIINRAYKIKLDQQLLPEEISKKKIIIKKKRIY